MSDGTFNAQVTSRKLIIVFITKTPSLECRSDPTPCCWRNVCPGQPASSRVSTIFRRAGRRVADGVAGNIPRRDPRHPGGWGHTDSLQILRRGIEKSSRLGAHSLPNQNLCFSVFVSLFEVNFKLV